MAVSLFRGSLRAVRVAPVFGAFARQCAPASSALLGVRFCSGNDGKVDIAMAKAMPRLPYEFSNESLMVMAASGATFAHRERMVREIMSVDECTWDEAQPKLLEMEQSNKSGLFFVTLPYRIGIVTGVFAAFSTIPLCFHEGVALWFNEAFVTTDVPPAEDRETWLEIGAWTWNWMEPPLGQLSFFLLCLQYTRAQMQNVGFKPYTDAVKARRANNLVQAYPAYDEHIVRSFADSMDLL